MATSSRDEIVAVFDALDGVVDRLCGLCCEVLTTPERLRALERLERVARRLRVPQHPLINQLAAQADKTEVGGTLCEALATRLGISKPCAGRRIAEAADLGPRRALTGQPLEPVLCATAAGQRAGRIGDGQITPKKSSTPKTTRSLRGNRSRYPTTMRSRSHPRTVDVGASLRLS